MTSLSSNGRNTTYNTSVRSMDPPCRFEIVFNVLPFAEPIENDLARQVEYDMDEQGSFVRFVSGMCVLLMLDFKTRNGSTLSMRKEKRSRLIWFHARRSRLSWTDWRRSGLTWCISSSSFCSVHADFCMTRRGIRLLWCTIYSRRTVALQEMYGFARKSSCEPIFSCLVLHVAHGYFQSCVLCPNEGGAFKQTVTGGWVHLLCAIWVPETRVANEVFMEPITGVDKISKQRWRLVCVCSHFLVRA